MPGPRLVAVNYIPDDLYEFWWMDEVLRSGFPMVADAAWPVGVKALDAGRISPHASILYRSKLGRRDVIIARFEGGLVSVILQGGTIYADAAAATLDEADEFLRLLQDAFPEAPRGNEPVVPVTFWWRSPSRAQSSRRSLEVPTWNDIAPNYPGHITGQALGRLMREFRPGEGGQLILLHGPAGTGKTFALRAMGWEWRHWCDLHYITDPEAFLISDPAYLHEVILHGDGERGAAARSDAQPRWRALLLEDNGEMLTPDAKQRVGQGMARLLNLVDGLIGQGLRVLTVITTNEDADELHPALARPGRCAANVQFAPFSAEEGAKWLADRGEADAISRLPSDSVTLAELHALQAGRETTGSRRVGFGP
jgi:hypothetical protein